MSISFERSATHRYDIIVIGSGPAGCAAAITGVQEGLSVLIVTDKPKEIPPAVLPLESVHPGISTLLDKLKISGAVDIASHATYHGVQTGNKKVLLGKDEQGTWVGDHIDRTRFDGELLKHAIQRGVQLMEGETVSQFIEKKIGWSV
jgi:flavin-dependent dehydrogenase